MPPTLYAAVKLALQNKGSRLPAATKSQVLQETAALLNGAFQPFLAGNFTTDGAEIKGILMVQETPRLIQLIQLVDLEMNPARFNYALGVGSISGKMDPEAYEESGPAWTRVNRALKEAARGNQDIVVRLPSSFLTRTVNTLFAIESDLRSVAAGQRRRQADCHDRAEAARESAEIHAHSSSPE